MIARADDDDRDRYWAKRFRDLKATNPGKAANLSLAGEIKGLKKKLADAQQVATGAVAAFRALQDATEERRQPWLTIALPTSRWRFLWWFIALSSCYWVGWWMGGAAW